MWLIFRKRGLQEVELEKDEKDSGETLIPSTDLPRAREKGSNAPFSNRLLNAGLLGPRI